jgi:hypothetical protein
LGAVLSEIDENAKATFSSIALATMLGLIERQQRGAPGPGTQNKDSRGAKPPKKAQAASRIP